MRFNQRAMTVAGGNGEGHRINQLRFPEGIFIDDNQSIYIADWGNARIVEWKLNETNGKVIAGGTGKGNKTNQLNGPVNVIFDKHSNSFFYLRYRKQTRTAILS